MPLHPWPCLQSPGKAGASAASAAVAGAEGLVEKEARRLEVRGRACQPAGCRAVGRALQHVT